MTGEAMRRTADRRRPYTAVWIIGGICMPLMAVFGWLAGSRGGPGAPAPASLAFTAAAVVGVTYAGAALVIARVSRLVGGNGERDRHLCSWALTYPPTILAFGANLAWHLRYATGAGPLDAPGWELALFWGVLGLALLWKVLLYLVYLRAVAGLNAAQSVKASAILFVVVLLYEWAIVNLGLGKIPFI
jgi:hypothetical protein